MKNLILILFICLLASCSSEQYKRPDSALETGRDFIRASLNGEFKTAEELLIKDTSNIQLFESYKRFYNKMPATEKANYKKASYEINKLEEVNDSTTLINYSNSYMKKPMNIKIIKAGDFWGVDFKYVYSDSTNQQ
ncbi:MAG: hypothetical protein ABIP68_01520 [Ferruginibacter sp.]